MKANFRVYAVMTELGERLVRAGSKAGAVGHVVKSSIRAEVASQETLIRLLSNNVDIEDAGVTEVGDDE